LATPFRVTNLQLIPTDYSGPPTTGYHEVCENIVDRDGVAWRCIETGIPGVWVTGEALSDFAHRPVAIPFTCGYYGGKIRAANIVTDVADGTVPVAVGVNYVEVHGNGVVEANQIGFAPTAFPMYILNVDALGVITHVNDRRAYFTVPVLEEASNVYNEIPAGAIDGHNRTYTTAHPFVLTTTRLSLRGLRQEYNVSYTEVGNNQVRFDEAPLTGDGIYIDYTRLF
jgi:hypothetical protein